MRVKNSNFVDYVKIFCRSGKGGAGSAHFRRDKTTAKGGPDGGDGGHGGNIYLQVSTNLSTLSDLIYNKHYKANRGKNGKGKNMHGKNGDDIFISVPPGTIVKNFETNQVIADLIRDREKILIAKHR